MSKPADVAAAADFDHGVAGEGVDVYGNVQVSRHQVALCWSIATTTTVAGLELLADAMMVLTAPTEMLDPARLTDLPWSRLIVRLAEMDLEVARRVALRLREHLIDVHLEADVHPVVMVVVHLALAGLELLRGDVDEAAGWRRAAESWMETDPELLRATEKRAELLLGM